MNKKLFLYVAATAVLASCSDDLTLQESSVVANVDGVNGRLVKAGLLASGQDEATRAFSGRGSFVWMAPGIDNTTNPGEVLDVDGDGAKDYPQIGLCWTGVNTAEPSFGATSEANANVFTNYLYEQVGWMQHGDKVLEYDECTGEVFNGAFYVNSGLQPEAHFDGSSVSALYDNTVGYGTNGVENPITHAWTYYDSPWGQTSAYGGWSNIVSTRYNDYYYSDIAGLALGQFTNKEGVDKDLNLGGGIFKTENSSVFEGQYIVYFPYNPDFKKGPIVASVGDKFAMDVHDDKYQIVSEEAFQLGVIKHYTGILAGKNREANFTTKTYSSTAQVRLYTQMAPAKDVRAVILYSAEKGIINQTGISAKSVLSAYAANDMSKVEQVAGTQKHQHSVYSYLSDSNTGKKYANINASNHILPSAGVKVAIPVLPQTISDLQVILMYEDYTTRLFDLSADKKTFAAGKATTIDIDVNGGVDNGYIAVDEESLVNAVGIIYTDLAASKNATIKLLRSIELGADVDKDGVEENAALYTAAGMPVAGEFRFKNNVTITADPSTLNCPDCKAPTNIIVKSLQGTAQTIRGIESDNALKTFTFNVPVIVEGTGCCAQVPAVFNVGGESTAVKDVIKFNKTVTNYGNTNVGSKLGLETAVTFADIVNTYDDEYVTAQGYTKGAYGKQTAIADATLDTQTDTEHGKYNAVLNIYSSLADPVVRVSANSLVNYGFVNIASKNAYSGSDATELLLGQRSLKVNIGSVENYGVAKGKDSFKAAVKDAETVATLDKVIGGDIEVTNNALVTIEKVQNENSYSYVHTQGVGKSAETDARIDVTAAGESANRGTWENDGVSNFLGGNFDNTKGLLIDKLNGQIGGKRIQNGTTPTNKYNYIDIRKAADGSEGWWQYKLENYQKRNYRGVAAEDLYQTDLNTGIYVAQVKTNERLAFLVNDAVESVSVNIVEIMGQNLGGYNLSNDVYQGKDLKPYDVMISGTGINIFADETDPITGLYVAEKHIGHCLDVQAATLTLDMSNVLSVVNNVFARKAVEVTKDNGQVVVGGNIYVQAGSQFVSATPDPATVKTPANIDITKSLVVEAAAVKVEFNRPVHTGLDIATASLVNTKATAGNPVESYFKVDQDVLIGCYGTLTSEGGKFTADEKTVNIVKRNFELYGTATFERYTTSLMGRELKGFFKSYKGSKFERKQLGSTDVYRATVNVYDLALTDGTTTTGWPTQIGF